MALLPRGIDRDELYVVSRRVLLDASEALGSHRSAAVLVGAQAVYVRSGSADLAVAAYTSDGDLALDPRMLDDDPTLERSMREAGFAVAQPGQWMRTVEIAGKPVAIAVDLLVPDQLAGSGNSRGARIPPHHKTAARRVPGLELCVVDFDVLPLKSLEPAVDERSFAVKVAGAFPLMVAKAYKLTERLGEPGQRRVSQKDAGDVIRLMMTSEIELIGAKVEQHLRHTEVADVAVAGLEMLESLFGGRRTPGTDLAVHALAGALPEERIRAIAPAFISALRGQGHASA